LIFIEVRSWKQTCTNEETKCYKYRKWKPVPYLWWKQTTQKEPHIPTRGIGTHSQDKTECSWVKND